MTIDPVVLSSITAAVSVLGHDYVNGIAGEAAKATWNAVKTMFGWHHDPPIDLIATEVSAGLSARPDMLGTLVELLKQQGVGSASMLVQNLTVTGGKVVIARDIQNFTM